MMRRAPIIARCGVEIGNGAVAHRFDMKPPLRNMRAYRSQPLDLCHDSDRVTFGTWQVGVPGGSLAAWRVTSIGVGEL